MPYACLTDNSMVGDDMQPPINGLEKSTIHFTLFQTFDMGRAKHIYQSPTGYTLVALNIAAWLLFLLVSLYTNTHWPAKKLFYLQLIGFFTAW